MKKPHMKESRYISSVAVWVPNVHALIEGCRYDSCYVESETEAHKVNRMIDSGAGGVIRLVRVARTDAPPTVDRWQSFGAYVLDVRHPQEAPLTDAELSHLADRGFAARRWRQARGVALRTGERDAESDPRGQQSWTTQSAPPSQPVGSTTRQERTS